MDGCVSICITKVEPIKEKKHITNQLQKFLLEFPNLTQKAKDFMGMAINDLTIIKQPTEEGAPFE